MYKYIGHDGISMEKDTGFYFSNKFDWILTKNKIIKKKEVPQTVYIKLDYIRDHFQTISNIRNNFILITACSDYSPEINFKKYQTKLLKKDNLIAWYAENNLSTNPKMYSLPVGLATHSIEYENKLINIFKQVDVDKKLDKVFCCWRKRDYNCCGQQYIERTDRLNNIIKKNSIYDKHDNLDNENFLKILSGYKYCLCPLGNGVDCSPKLLECFFMKTIPIVKKNFNLLKLYSQFPVIFVNNFEELNNLKLEYDRNINWENIIKEFEYNSWYNKIINHL